MYEEKIGATKVVMVLQYPIVVVENIVYNEYSASRVLKVDPERNGGGPPGVARIEGRGVHCHAWSCEPPDRNGSGLGHA
jgi:hypothetical protein